MDVIKPSNYSKPRSFYWIGLPLALVLVLLSLIAWHSTFTYMPEVMLGTGILLALLVLVIFHFYDRYHLSSIKAFSALQEAKKNADYTKKILESINQAFITIDTESNILEWNPWAEKIFGWHKYEVLGCKMYDLIIPPAFREAHKKGINQFIHTGDQNIFNKTLELPALTKNGQELPIELTVFPLKFEGVYTFHAFLNDISERKKSEADHARYATIIQASDDAILSSDIQGIIQTWNRGAEKLYGYNENEAIGKPTTFIYPPEIKTNFVQIRQRISAGEHIHNFDTIRQKKSGEIIPVSASVSPIRNSVGKIIGITSITRDMTESKKIEKMKNEFISIVSHELRTPLTSIRGSLDLLNNEKIAQLSGEAKHLLKIANANCERLIRLVSDILDVEKIAAGKMNFHFKSENMNQLIADAVAANQGLADKYQVTLNFQAQTSIDAIVDADRIEQVLSNLFSNAIRYSTKGDRVEIGLEKTAKIIRISIKDCGPGIPKEFHDKIFGKFNQADSSATRAKGGSGLGLHISKSIIEKHGGKIYFESQPDKGTCFYVELPLLVLRNPSCTEGGRG